MINDCGIIRVISSISAASEVEGDALTARGDGDPPPKAAEAVEGRRGTGDLPLLIDV